MQRQQDQHRNLGMATRTNSNGMTIGVTKMISNASSTKAHSRSRIAPRRHNAVATEWRRQDCSQAVGTEVAGRRRECGRREQVKTVRR